MKNTLSIWYINDNYKHLQNANCKTEYHPEHPFRGIYFFQIRGWSLASQMYMLCPLC